MIDIKVGDIIEAKEGYTYARVTRLEDMGHHTRVWGFWSYNLEKVKDIRKLMLEGLIDEAKNISAGEMHCDMENIRKVIPMKILNWQEEMKR